MLLIAALSLQIANKLSSIQDETKRLFEWFDSLGYSRMLDRPFVEVSCHETTIPWNIEGFLIRDNAGTFDILTPEMAIFTFHKNQAKGRAIKGSYTRSNFGDFVRETLSTPNGMSGRRRTISGISGNYNRGALAWICAKKNLKTDSETFLKFLTEQHISESTHSQPLMPSELIASDKQHVIDQMMTPEILRFGDPSFSFTDLLVRFKGLSKKVGNCQEAKEFAEVTQMLDSMVREEQVHSTVNLSSLSLDERISELIWQLRNETAEYDAERRAASTALIQIGRPAIPQLTKALKDQRFTRCISTDRSGVIGYSSLTDIRRVKDFAQVILDEINSRKTFND